jgi:cytochrome c biogenesis protein
LGKQTVIENEEKPAGLRANPVWRILSSLQLALVLMLVLIGLSLIGTFLIQVPAESTQNAEQYNYWLENAARPETGAWYPVLHLLGLFNVFHSVWFLGAGALLAISIIICTLNRWRQIKIAVSLSSPAKNAEYYLSADHAEIKASLPPADVRSKLSAVFKRNRYTLQEDNADGNLYAVADKNRFSPLGTYLIHLSLILFIIGFLIGSYLGFRNSSFIVAEGETRAVGNGTGLSLNLQSFTDEYWENGSPKDYRSQVTILDNGREVKQGIVQVNHPLSYKGIRFYQSFFGDTARLEIKDAQGTLLFSGSVSLSQTLDDYPYVRPAGSVQAASSGYTFYVVGRAKNVADSQLAPDQIGIEVYQGKAARPVVATRLKAGVPYKSADLEITYSGSGKFSGFQVSRDPGNSLIWISSTLFLLGLVIVFYFPRRQVRFMLQSGPGNLSKIYLRLGVGRKTGSEAEIKRLEAVIKKDLG